MATLKIPLHGNGVVTREAIIKGRRSVVLKFVRGITEAIHLIKADKEGTKAIIAKYTKLNDPEGLERTYRNHFRANGCAVSRPGRNQDSARRHGAEKSQGGGCGSEVVRRPELRP